MTIPRIPTFKLLGHLAVPCDNLLEWSEWYESADRRVAEDWIDDVRISTVFLGICPLGQSEPLLFETAVFLAGAVHQMQRYSLWEDAQAGHAEAVNLFQAELIAAKGKADEALAAVLCRKVGQ
ncbi:hypothetical protein LL969_07370 [Xanthomonas campestris pv. phormiicola]|nr:hypothetical protein [Xanthomonas campestris pv. phormiicola]